MTVHSGWRAWGVEDNGNEVLLVNLNGCVRRVPVEQAAAAPELVKACKAALDYFDSTWPGMSGLAPDVSIPAAIKAALALAEAK